MPLLQIDARNQVNWQAWIHPLQPPGVAVFRYQISPADQAWLYGLLQPEEHERAARFRQVADKQRFVAGRGWLRWLAGQLTNVPTAAIRLVTGPAGKPELVPVDGGKYNWHINVSHAGDWVLLAVGYVPVGVDVEWINPGWPFHDLIASSFNAADQADIIASETPRDLFYTFWTRKESLFKATGQGLTNDFNQISASKGVHQVGNGLPEGPETWSILSFPVTDGYIGAVACQESPITAHFFTLETASPNLTASNIK